ncbi:MAG: hypothetical protein KME26_32005 [Oscillatoria princeps RMCB-10]|nr:hypothetical protein [Oscillatoria princeps RMCB-10]
MTRPHERRSLGFLGKNIAQLRCGNKKICYNLSEFSPDAVGWWQVARWQVARRGVSLKPATSSPKPQPLTPKTL